jgi:hypothetical protein
VVSVGFDKDSSKKLKDIRKEAVFAELAVLTKKKALIENKLMDLYYKELNLRSAPDKFDFFPSNKPNGPFMPFRPDPYEEQSGGMVHDRNERTIGNVIVCFPKGENVDKPQDRAALMEIKRKKMDLLKRLNLLMQKISTLERQHSALERPEFPSFLFG